MGHHPLQQVGTGQLETTSSGLSPVSWFLILIVILIVGYIIYNFIKGGKRK